MVDLATTDPLSGASLYADVLRYESFGSHRLGSQGAERTFAWLAAELSRAGMAVSAQPFTVARQYDLQGASLLVGDQRIEVTPQFWPLPAHASFRLRSPIVATGDARGAFVRLSIPYEQTSYLTDTHHVALKAAFARHPAAVLLTIEHPSGELFVHNVDQDQDAWPVPVLLVASKDRAVLDRAMNAGTLLDLTLDGRYRYDLPARNVIGRLDRASGLSVVVSTPITSWFTSAGERGPGVAAFLALARIAGKRLDGFDLCIVGTAGHEIGHVGMQHFIAAQAPPINRVVAWLHLGSSLACSAWRRDAAGVWVTNSRLDTENLQINRSRSLDAPVRKHLSRLGAADRVGESAAVGELREVFAAGYPNFFGVAGEHAFFHTPIDTSSGTAPELLEPVVGAIAATLAEIVARAG